MKTIKSSLVSTLLTVLVACTFGGGQALAHEQSSSKSGNFSFSWNFGSNTQYGSNRTKGSGELKEESRNVANFSRILLALPADVTLTQGNTESLTVSADDNLLPLMTTRVDNGELVIEGDKNRGFSTRNSIKIRLSVRSLGGITIKGSGDIHGDQLNTDKFDLAILGSGDVRFKSIRADQFKLSIKGSGDVTVGTLDSKLVDVSIQGSGDIRLPSLQARTVNFSVNGSGDIQAAGNADKVDVEINGSGDVRTRSLVAREANVRISASGDAAVHASEKLTARVSGSGDIRYAGSPATVDRTIRGSGSIEPI